MTTRLDGYRLALLGGLATSCEIGVALTIRAGASSAPAVGAICVLAFVALAGSRVLFLASGGGSPRDGVWHTSRAGAAVFGGIVPVLALILPLSYAVGLGAGQFADIVVLAAVPGMAIGRLGCLAHGCCRGRLGTPFERLPLLDAGLGACLVGALATLYSREPQAGLVAVAGCLGYSAIRFTTDFFRAEPTRGTLRQSQLIAIGVSVTSAAAAVAVLVN